MMISEQPQTGGSAGKDGHLAPPDDRLKIICSAPTAGTPGRSPTSLLLLLLCNGSESENGFEAFSHLKALG